MADCKDNLVFIYMPFACRGKEKYSIEEIPFFSPTQMKYWDMVSRDDDESLEELYLYSYMFGLKAGQEDSRKKYRHYIFTGPKSEDGDALPGTFLDALLRTFSESTPGSLFDLRRALRETGPICDGGSHHLEDATLGNLLFGSATDMAVSDGELPACDCWRIYKAHRYPRTPLEHDQLQRVKRPDEERQDRWQFLFDIHRVHCYQFSTGVAILAFELSFRVPERTPQTAVSDWVASGMFHLKKVQNASILPIDSSQCREEPQEEFAPGLPLGLSFCNLGKLLACDLLGVSADADAPCGRPYLFFHVPAIAYKSGANNGTDDDSEAGANEDRRKSMRANSLVYVAERETDEDATEGAIARKLFYLSNCFDTNIPYTVDSYLKPEVIVDAPDIRWGFTPENLACLTSYAEGTDEPYVTRGFLDHFKRQYQFVYVLLLHQKYYYYLLLNEIGARTDNYGALQEHKEKLESFNAGFTFSRITEEAHYQQIYEMGADVMGLTQLKEDVHEPLERLITLQDRHEAERDKQAAEKQERITKYIGIFGIIIALLSLGSVVTDVSTFIASGIDKLIAYEVLLVIAILVVLVLSLFFLVPKIRARTSGQEEV